MKGTIKRAFNFDPLEPHTAAFGKTNPIINETPSSLKSGSDLAHSRSSQNE